MQLHLRRDMAIRISKVAIVGKDDGSESKHRTTVAGNSQANAIMKRIHQVPGNLLRIFDLDKVDLDEGNPWDEFLAATTFAIRSTVTNTICFTSSACM